MTHASQLAQLSDPDVLAAIASAVCPVCGRDKSSGQPFCATDSLALPMPARWALGKAKAGSAEQISAVRTWARHLQLQPERRRVVISSSGASAYRSLAEWEAAGYRFSRHAQCNSARCLAPIVWLITPGRAYFAVDAATWKPHNEVCRDPGWFERRKTRRAEEKQQRRALKTSARRRRPA